jgi:cytochrome c-type biogenesis protein
VVELLTTGSILAAFFAGAVALFSPCCIAFLLPAYMATAVKNRRWRLLPLTLIFAAGLALVLLPITVGVALVSSAIARYHVPLYAGGGFLLLVLAALSLSGRSWSMPSFLHAPSLERSDTAGVLALGVFSGVASSCCAPVLAGVATLSALSSSAAGSVGLGLAYVFGMAFPLFVLAMVWDRLRLGERGLPHARPVRLRVAGRDIATNTVNVAVAVVFALMGLAVLALAAGGNPTAAPSFQLAVGRWLSTVFAGILSFLEPVPEPVLGLALLALAGSIFVAAARGKRPSAGRSDRHDHEACTTHGSEDQTSHVDHEERPVFGPGGEVVRPGGEVADRPAAPPPPAGP